MRTVPTLSFAGGGWRNDIAVRAGANTLNSYPARSQVDAGSKNRPLTGRLERVEGVSCWKRGFRLERRDEITNMTERE